MKNKRKKLKHYLSRLNNEPPDNRFKPLALRGVKTTKQNNSFILTQIEYNG